MKSLIVWKFYREMQVSAHIALQCLYFFLSYLFSGRRKHRVLIQSSYLIRRICVGFCFIAFRLDPGSSKAEIKTKFQIWYLTLRNETSWAVHQLWIHKGSVQYLQQFLYRLARRRGVTWQMFKEVRKWMKLSQN